MDVWETTVGRPPKSNAAMMLLFEGEEVDVIAASDIFGGHGRYEKLQISYLLEGLFLCVRAPGMPIRTAILPTRPR
jgi:hypothetical protein